MPDSNNDGFTDNTGIPLVKQQSQQYLTVNQAIMSMENLVANMFTVNLLGANVDLNMDQARYAILKITGSPVAQRTITYPPGLTKPLYILNETVDGTPDTIVKTRDLASDGVSIPPGRSVVAFLDGVNVVYLSDNSLAERLDAIAPVNTVITVDSDTALSAENRFVTIDTTAGNVTVTLPDASVVKGIPIYFLKIGANVATVQGGGGSTIDGAASFVIPAANKVFGYISDITNWFASSTATSGGGGGGGGGTGDGNMVFSEGTEMPVDSVDGHVLWDETAPDAIIEGAITWVGPTPPPEYYPDGTIWIKTDIAVSPPHAKTDYFTGDTLDPKWSLWNTGLAGGAGSITVEDGFLVGKPTVNPAAWMAGIRQPIPVGNFKARGKFGMVTPPQTGSWVFSGLAMWTVDSSKFMRMGYMQSIGGFSWFHGLSCNRYVAAGTFDGAEVQFSTGNHYHYVEMERIGSSVICRFSDNGRVWSHWRTFTLGSEIADAGYIGIIMGADNPITPDHTFYCEYFEVTQ